MQTVSESIVGYPILLLVLSLAVLFLSTRFGVYLGRKRRAVADAEKEDLGLLVSATLTLLGLLIGFSFSMAISRYDQRKNLEEEEANAIGTEYLRADLLPSASAAQGRLGTGTPLRS